MAKYNYVCTPCSKMEKNRNKPENWLIFEVEHGMNEKPKIRCPKCGKTDTEVCFQGYEPTTFYVRGKGWLDVHGRRRDMHLWKLQNDDPYSSMRQSGEKDDLIHRLKKAGRVGGNAKVFGVAKPTGKKTK